MSKILSQILSSFKFSTSSFHFDKLKMILKPILGVSNSVSTVICLLEIRIKPKKNVNSYNCGNNCGITKLKFEAEITFNHVVNFASTKSSNKTWPMLFSLKHELGIKNFLHVAEISIVLPICNAELERVFSFLWHAFSKECRLLKNNTLEDILCLRSDMDYKPSKYDHAIELLLSKYPNNTVRKRSHHLDGHNYPKKRKSCGQKNKLSVNVDWLQETISSS